MRVVSLVPSITETLRAWDVHVVACTRFCEQPEFRTVGGTKDPDLAAIIDLAPDLVVVDREENRREDAEALMAAGIKVHVTHVTHIEQVVPTLRELAGAVGADAGLAEMGLAEMGLAEVEPVWTTAVVPIWRRPWMVLGAHTYGASVLASLGVRTLPEATADRYPAVELDSVAPVDLVVLPSEPYPFAVRHLAEVRRLVPSSRGVLVDGRDLLWWGVRTPAALGRLRAVLRAAPTPR